MPLGLQGKLLRALQDGEIRRVGSALSRKVDVRVMAATNRNLKEEVKSGRFRQDLLFRLEVIEIATPALRDRLDDIPILTKYFLSKFCQVHQKQIHGFAPEAIECLQKHSWPGNVRELSNVIERAVVFSRSELVEVKDLPAHISIMSNETANQSASGSIELPLGISLKEAEDILIRKTLEATSGDKNMTATLLGINSRTIYRKLDKKP
jgi:two-component system response regulator HydG